MCIYIYMYICIFKITIKGYKMLVLTRKVGETIIIGNDITVTVLGVNSRNQIKIGINAPESVDVHREEIYQRIQREKK